MKRAYYSNTISLFLASRPMEVLGELADKNEFALEQEQRRAWLAEITILQEVLQNFQGAIYFEYSIPRMGGRVDIILVIRHVIFALEFKIGAKDFASDAIDQVWDYALDLKYFHETSHEQYIAPILVASEAIEADICIATTLHNDKLLFPVKTNPRLLKEVMTDILSFTDGDDIDRLEWEEGRYRPTPTIIEAARALYSGHSVDDITRRDADAINLTETSEQITTIIRDSKERSNKSICFVTGVPGAGKTLVGLDIATKHIDKESELYSVFLSGNGPLVTILREALARDKVQSMREQGTKIAKNEAMREVKAFIQNVHNFRDECLLDTKSPPIEHVVLFDEAQRAWNLVQTASFMQRRKKKLNFSQSEPEFLISCLDRHRDWAVIVCLVGGGQEIHTGEAGIDEWIEAILRSFPEWHIYLSSRLTDSEYGAGKVLSTLASRENVFYREALHLSVSMRSFRSENVSLLVKQMLDCDVKQAGVTLKRLDEKYPIVITRDINKAKRWLKQNARGSERYGIVVSSQAERLRPHAINVKSPINPIHWFLNNKEDIRSSYYLEDVATEFQIQGLELDWACVTWDADFRHSPEGWEHWSFKGKRWYRIKKMERKKYQKNAYRVLLTRARQGMVIVVPPGDIKDPTRPPCFYDSTFKYLQKIGFREI